MIDCTFIVKIENYKYENPSSELVYFIKQGLDLEVLYDALRSLYMVIYNARLFKRKGRIFVSYQFSDIDNVIKPMKDLADALVKLGVEPSSAPEKAIELCRQNYLLSAADREITKVHEYEKEQDEFQYGYIGIHSRFNEFASDVWDSIKNDMLIRIKQGN